MKGLDNLTRSFSSATLVMLLLGSLTACDWLGQGPAVRTPIPSRGPQYTSTPASAAQGLISPMHSPTRPTLSETHTRAPISPTSSPETRYTKTAVVVPPTPEWAANWSRGVVGCDPEMTAGSSARI